MLYFVLVQSEVWLHPQDQLRLRLVNSWVAYWLADVDDWVDVFVCLGQENLSLDVIQVAIRS